MPVAAVNHRSPTCLCRFNYGFGTTQRISLLPTFVRENHELSTVNRCLFYSRFTVYGNVFSMKILLIGDVVAKPGRTALLDRLQDLREQHSIDLAIMNAENLAGGFSITP